jgi:hypothetical protein
MSEKGVTNAYEVSGTCHCDGRSLFFDGRQEGRQFADLMYLWLTSAGFDHVLWPYRVRIRIEATRLTDDEKEEYWANAEK